MRITKSAALGALLAVAASICPRTCAAQSAAKIINQSVRAMGGAKALAKIHAEELEGTATEVGEPSSGTFTLLIESPDKYYREMTFGEQRTAEGCNGKSCWREAGEGNFFTLLGEAEARAEATAKFINLHLANLKKAKIRAEIVGKDMVKGRAADVVDFRISSGEMRRVYFDAASHLIVKEMVESVEWPVKSPAPAQDSAGAKGGGTSSPGGGVPETIFYSDYRRVQGIMEPFAMKIAEAGKTYEIALSRVSLNAPIDETAFGFPALSTKPLPDVAHLLSDVDKNQKKIDEIKEDYACMKLETNQEVDGQGNVKKQTQDLYQISYVHGHEIYRRIQENGKPLSLEQQKKEDERVQRRVDRANREATEKDSGEKKKNDDDVTIADFLRIMKFTNPRWERFRGQEVVVFDFGPNPDYKPKKMAEKIIHDLSGVVWIDPNARDVVRLEARLDKTFRIGGGVLASLQKDSAFVFEQTLVNGQVWLPSYDEVHLGAKLLLVKTLRADEIDRYYDYQKFSVETKEEIGSPEQP